MRDGRKEEGTEGLEAMREGGREEALGERNEGT